MGEVIKLEDEFYAGCPKCGCQQWLLKIDGPGDRWENILGSECYECGFFVDWLKVIKENKK